MFPGSAFAEAAMHQMKWQTSLLAPGFEPVEQIHGSPWVRSFYNSGGLMTNQLSVENASAFGRRKQRPAYFVNTNRRNHSARSAGRPGPQHVRMRSQCAETRNLPADSKPLP